VIFDMDKAESMSLTKVIITECNCGFDVGSIVYWDENRVTNAPMNDGDVVYNGDMTEQRWQHPDDMEVLMNQEGTGNG
jgi:hypothetical protein